ncbi:hypothetical protein V8C44DRAFT_63943 [Trichoderma aethiopicum]
MERHWQRGRKGAQESASSDPDLMHTGYQFIGRGDSSSEIADATLPNLSRLSNNDSYGGIDDEPEADKASGPKSSRDSFIQSLDWKSLLGLVPTRPDPWFPMPKLSWATSIHAKEEAFKFAVTQFFEGLSTTLPKSSGSTISQSEHTDSAYASMPGDAPTECPANWTRQPQYTQPKTEAPLAQYGEHKPGAHVVLSDRAFVNANHSQDYVCGFSRLLYQRIRPLLTIENASCAVDLLPDLLAAFALQKGQESQDPLNQHIRYFVYKHRLIIAQSLGAFYETEQASIASPLSGASLASVTERISLIRSIAPQKGNLSTLKEGLIPVTDDNSDEGSGHDFSHYQEALTAGPAFQWVIETLKRELSPSSAGLHTMEKISSDILKGLSENQEISKRHPPKPSKLTFHVSCDIFAYMQEQGYAMDAADVLPRAITLTGSSTNAQALTVRQYMCQTWPTIECHLVQAIQAALRMHKASGEDASNPFEDLSKYTVTSDGTHIRVSFGEKMMIVEAVGTARSISEIGEQLGWLAATLSCSPKQRVISFCHPEISEFGAHMNEDGFDSTFICRLNIVTEQLRDNLPSVNGQCWYCLFNNPVVVTGYPIKPRENLVVGAGLELPFDMMAALSECQFLTTWEGKTVLKGFSTMLIPTGVQNNVIFWHLIVSEAGQRLSYGDDRVSKGISIAPRSLPEARHVLGWCAEAQNDIGAPGANYNIGWSGLPLAENDLSWGPVTTSFGVGGFFKVSSDFTRGNRERITSSYTGDQSSSTGDYNRSLVRHIGQQHFLLWDVDEKRGWLTDGSRAHLHLVRASLWEDHREKPNGYHIDQIRRLDELARLKENATEVLLDAENLDTEAEPRDPAYFSLKTRMQEIGCLMEKAIDQVRKATNSQGTSVGIPVHVLEGFDFMDVATLRDLHRHTLKLPLLETGDGWINIVPHLPVVTLFGKGFGDLIRPGANNPTKSCENCGFVVSLPLGRHLLAVCVDVLEKILRIRGNKDSCPWQLINEVYWPTREPVFEPCRCTSSDGRGNNNGRVQMLSKRKPRGASLSKPIKLEKRGAVIFGHSFRLSLGRSRLFPSHDRASFSSNISNATQTTNQVADVPVSATHDETFDTNENPLSDTISSTTPITATWSRTEDLVSNDTTIEQQNQAPATDCAKTDTFAASPPIIELRVPAKPPRKRPAKRVRGFCTTAWKKVKMIKPRRPK